MISRSSRMVFVAGFLGGVWELCVFAGGVGVPAGTQAPLDPKTDIKLAISVDPHLPRGAEVVAASLSKRLNEQKGILLLDRKDTDKILAEQALGLGAVAREPAKAGKILGVAYFVLGGYEEDIGVGRVAIICVEVSSGNVIYEGRHAAALPLTIQGLDSFIARVGEEIPRHIVANERGRGKVSATVLRVTNKSVSRRLDSMESSLRGVLEGVLESAGWRVLRRQYPGLLASEAFPTVSPGGLPRRLRMGT